MNQFKRKLINQHPTLTKKQLDVLLGAYQDGVEESVVQTFANSSLSVEIMSLARSDAMDGYFVNTWLDLDFSEEQMRVAREEMLYYEEKKLAQKL